MMPGTSFHSITWRAPSDRASTVAVRSVPPRPSVVMLPSGARPMNPGTTAIVPALISGRRTRRASFRVSSNERRRAAMHVVGADDVERVDILNATANRAARQRRCEQPGRQLLSSRRERVERARRQVPEDPHRGADIRNSRGRRCRSRRSAACAPAGGDERARRLLVLAPQRLGSRPDPPTAADRSRRRAPTRRRRSGPSCSTIRSAAR